MTNEAYFSFILRDDCCAIPQDEVRDDVSPQGSQKGKSLVRDPNNVSVYYGPRLKAGGPDVMVFSSFDKFGDEDTQGSRAKTRDPNSFAFYYGPWGKRPGALAYPFILRQAQDEARNAQNEAAR